MSWSDEPGQTSSPRTYHQFLDRRHPDNYRREEITLLARAIRAKENRLVLGLPGMGVSNLLRFLVARPNLVGREVYFAYLNCPALGDCLDLEQVFETTAEQLHEQGLGPEPKADERGYQRFHRLVTRSGGDSLDRLVIVADQVDTMVGGVNSGFYRQLKALTDLNKRLCYIFGASPYVANEIDPNGLLFAGRRLMVGPLNERDCTGAITEEMQRLEVKFDLAMQKRVAYLTGGHPGLLRAVTSAIVEMSRASGKVMDEPEVEYLLALESVNSRCQKIWDELDLVKQTGLQFLVGGLPEAITAE